METAESEEIMNIIFEKTKNPLPKPDLSNPLPFGHYFTDHMFIMKYDSENKWHDARIIPFQNLSISPAAMIFHYGQEVFEGLKAYRTTSGTIQLFRPEMNARRAIQSNERLCIPTLDEEDFVQAVKALVKVDADWIPEKKDASLYIRPFFIATDECLGVKIASHYLFVILLSPSGPYYAKGLKPVSIMVEDHYVRAFLGGTGAAKTSGNYAASLIGQRRAYRDGYDQVLWLDGIEHRYIEEVGAMNIFFKIADKVITPKLDGSILAGITRDSIIQLCKAWHVPVEERFVTIDEIVESYKNKTLEEVFGSGTAAVISPVGKLSYQGVDMIIHDNKTGPFSKKLYDTITQIQRGEIPDIYHWTVPVN